jgi:hypothetical protein
MVCENKNIQGSCQKKENRVHENILYLKENFACNNNMYEKENFRGKKCKISCRQRKILEKS